MEIEGGLTSLRGETGRLMDDGGGTENALCLRSGVGERDFDLDFLRCVGLLLRDVRLLACSKPMGVELDLSVFTLFPRPISKHTKIYIYIYIYICVSHTHKFAPFLN